mmetsp:Transcript_6459/g.14920  ORF Transcript_6459/g.14920 Transcript_6459/m.14920 type:complete len:230 (+) Transcript_6459:137-826(+)
MAGPPYQPGLGTGGLGKRTGGDRLPGGGSYHRSRAADAGCFSDRSQSKLHRGCHVPFNIFVILHLVGLIVFCLSFSFRKILLRDKRPKSSGRGGGGGGAREAHEATALQEGRCLPSVGSATSHSGHDKSGHRGIAASRSELWSSRLEVGTTRGAASPVCCSHQGRATISSECRTSRKGTTTYRACRCRFQVPRRPSSEGSPGSGSYPDLKVVNNKISGNSSIGSSRGTG